MKNIFPLKNKAYQYYFDLAITFGLVLIDQLVKQVFLHQLASSQKVGGKWFYLELVLNRGAIWGINLNQLVIIGGTIVILGLLTLYYFRHFRTVYLINRFGFLLVFAGALANLIDRLFRGRVVDWLHLSSWPAFNLADLFLIGGVIWILCLLFKRQR